MRIENIQGPGVTPSFLLSSEGGTKFGGETKSKDMIIVPTFNLRSQIETVIDILLRLGAGFSRFELGGGNCHLIPDRKS